MKRKNRDFPQVELRGEKVEPKKEEDDASWVSVGDQYSKAESITIDFDMVDNATEVYNASEEFDPRQRKPYPPPSFFAREGCICVLSSVKKEISSWHRIKYINVNPVKEKWVSHFFLIDLNRTLEEMDSFLINPILLCSSIPEYLKLFFGRCYVKELTENMLRGRKRVRVEGRPGWDISDITQEEADQVSPIEFVTRYKEAFQIAEC